MSLCGSVVCVCVCARARRAGRTFRVLDLVCVHAQAASQNGGGDAVPTTCWECGWPPMCRSSRCSPKGAWTQGRLAESRPPVPMLHPCPLAPSPPGPGPSLQVLPLARMPPGGRIRAGLRERGRRLGIPPAQGAPIVPSGVPAAADPVSPVFPSPPNRYSPPPLPAAAAAGRAARPWPCAPCEGWIQCGSRSGVELSWAADGWTEPDTFFFFGVCAPGTRQGNPGGQASPLCNRGKMHSRTAKKSASDLNNAHASAPICINKDIFCFRWSHTILHECI